MSSARPSLSATSWAMSTSTPMGVLLSVAWKDSGMDPAVVATVSLPSLPIAGRYLRLPRPGPFCARIRFCSGEVL